MTSVSQLVPAYSTGGISDQPDELKKPGQVRDAVNIYPDITYGVAKRPGLKAISSLSDRCTGQPALTEGSWFHFYRDNPSRKVKEQYIGSVSFDGAINVWDCETGNPVKVYYTDTPVDPNDAESIDLTDLQLCSAELPSYLSHEQQQFLQFLSVNNYTFITNPSRAVTMSSPNEVRPYEAFIEITQLVYGREYLFDIDLLNTDTTSSYKRVTEVELVSAGDFGGDRKDPSCPANFLKTVTLDSTYLHDTEDRGQSGLTLTINSTGVQVPVDSGKRYECEYRHDINLLNGGRNWEKGDKVRYFQNGETSASNNDDPFYTIKIKEVERISSSSDFQITGVVTPTNGDEIATIKNVLEQMKTAVEALSVVDTVEIVGNGLYLRHSEPFTVTTSEKDLMNVLANEDTELENPVVVVNNVSRLPIECKNGLLAKVSNAFSSEDDYWVQFKANYGDVGSTRDTPATGYWEEVSKPGENVVINSATMPHSLVYAREGGETVMVLAPVMWASRSCGDKSFNPSFENFTINNLIYFRNRLVALSQENVVMTNAGDLFNWFPQTALAVSPTDPIDITATTSFSSVLQDALVINNGLVIFSDYQQFLFTTDSDILDPTTAKISEISQYDYNIGSRPFKVGDNIAFLGNSDSTSKFYEMSNVFREGPVDVVDRSKIVTKSLGKNLTEIADSNEIGLFVAGNFDSSTVWCYRYFKEGSQSQLQSVWFKWDLPDDLVFHLIIDDFYYAVLNRNGTPMFCRLKLDEAHSNSLNFTDYWQQLEPTYDGKFSTFDYDNSDSDSELYLTTNRGHFIELSGAGPYVLQGDFRNIDATIGFKYEMLVEVPHVFVSKVEQQAYRSDTSGSLVVHRMKFNFVDVGAYTFTIDRKGRDSYDVLFESTPMDAYEADDLAIMPVSERPLPVYCRNTDLNVTLRSSRPAPCILHSMRWEGDYNQRYYRRV